MEILLAVYNNLWECSTCSVPSQLLQIQYTYSLQILQVAEGTKEFPHPLQDPLLYIFSNNSSYVLKLVKI
jgi:hypothetical protein